MDFIFDWEAEGDRFSFEDSDRFEEDSLCSWISEPESLCNNWRGWRKPNGLQQSQVCGHLAQNNVTGRDTSTLGQIPALVELVAQAVACHIPFEIVEHFYPPIPEQLQLRIAFWSFPESEEDIRLYSCLANGSADEFQKGESLFKSKAVNDALQIGFHLSATVTVTSQGPAAVAVNGAVNPSKGEHKVALVFDRRHITSCSCSCANGATWCAHVVALCLFRIHQPNQVKLRAPVSESLSRLERDQLQKFAQYLISALPQQLLPIAQRLLDDLLSSQQSDINTVCGAPDPTAGPAANEQTTWCLNEGALHDNIKKTLSKFCVPSPMVLSDVNFLTNSAPPAATEWQTLLRPLRGREPEGIWNLLSIVREMFRRNDANAVTLLEIITDELLGSEQIVSWWFNNKTAHHHSNASLHGNRGGGVQTSGGGSGSAPLAAAGLCDEVVTLWRLAALNPSLTLSQRNELSLRLSQWQSQCIDKLCKLRPNNNNTLPSSVQHRLNIESLFPGFMPAIEACQLDWSDLSLPGGVADLLRWCSHWGHVSGSWVPSRCVATSSASASVAVGSSNQKLPVPDGELSNKEESSSLRVDLLSNSRMREAGRKVLMPSERSPHSTLRPISSSSASSGRKYDTDDVDGGLCKTMAGCNVNSDDGSHPATRLPGQEDSKRDIADVISTDEQSQQKQSDLPLLENGACSSQAEQNVAVVKDNKQEVLFALAEALHAHGHTREACRLARQLAEEMLATDAVTVTAAAPEHSTHHKDKSKKLTVTSFASSTLAKVSFLCTVLLEDPENRHLAFRIGLYGMEMPRPPAASKSLEVKLAHQEYELASVLKKLTLGPAEVAVIRDRAERLRDGKLKMRGDALLPITLASFIFDSLCVSQSNRSVASASQMTPVQHLAPQDEKLGFEAAVAALGLKANVSEAEHPLLCEGTRRQKGELAVTMLVQYKDDPAKLHRIMDKLLDKEMHQLYKALPHDTEVSNYFGSNLSGLKVAAGNGNANRETFCDGTTEGDDGYGAETADVYKNVSEQDRDTSDAHASGCRAKIAGALGRSNADDMAVDDDTEGSGDYKAWEAKFRCTNLKSTKKHSVGMASIDSSAPETTSSDNSPTLVRRNILSSVSGTATAPLHAGPGSDSGSSHSDSVDSSSSGCKQSSQQQQQQQLRNTSRLQPKDTDCALNILESSPQFCVYNNRSLPAAAKGSRYKGGKSRIMPVLPNQPSEASAHFMFELAKTVLIKAGGNSSTSMFVNQSSSSTANNSQSGPHRALHLCAFQIGLYALGLHNCVNTNWLSRTYSSHVSWIAGQAMEIGYPAIEILIKTWEGHLTPQEAASLADKASRCRDPHMVRAAAELALSCLKHAHALNPPEIQRALLQCKEQSSDMLQRACLSIESMAKDGVVCSDTLFEVAKRWYELYEESSQSGSVPVQPARSIPAALAAAAAATVPTSIASFQSVNDNAMGVPAAVAPPTAQEGITLLQLAPSSVAPHGTLGPYQPGTVSFVPPQPIQLVPHPYGQYTYVHQIPGANQASAPQHRQWYSLPLQHNGQPMNLVRYPYQASPYIAANPPVPGMALPPPTPQQLAAVSPAYLPQGMQGMPAAIYHSARPPPVHVTYLPSAAALPARYGGGTSAALLNDATAVAVSVNSVIEQGAMMHHVNAGQQLQSQQPMQQQQQQLAGDEVQAAAGAVAVIGNETVHNNYLLATFRVGMMAMDALAKRVHDDRPNLKFSRNPSYGEDVKWLQGVACKLGTSYLQQFCVSVVNTIVSPFILFDIAMESANYLARNSMGQASQQIRLPMINSLLQKCLQMFGSCAQAKLHHITPSDYDDFVSIVCSARNAFCMVPGGMTQFNEMLQSLRRSKYCKKDLWQRVISGLHSTNNV